MNVDKLKESWVQVAGHGGDIVAHWFYAHLFVHYPETRDLFPVSMAAQRDRLVQALGRIVSNVDQLDDLVPYLEDLGRDHRKFGALAAHFPAVGDSLLATLAHFSGGRWTATLEADWAAAYGLVADVMTKAADDAAQTTPAHWEARVTEVEQRAFDIAILRLSTDVPVPYQAGQSLALEATDIRPRLWRWYSPANPPGGTDIELHVRMVPGGAVSSALVRSSSVGDRVRLGPPIGHLALEPDSVRPVLMIAGGTGFAPLKAVIGQLAAAGKDRQVALYFGVRRVGDIYDYDALEKLNAAHDWLTVTIVVSEDPVWPGPQGLVGEVALAAQDWSGHDVHVCGSPDMVAGTVQMVIDHGIPAAQIKYDAY